MAELEPKPQEVREESQPQSDLDRLAQETKAHQSDLLMLMARQAIGEGVKSESNETALGLFWKALEHGSRAIEMLGGKPPAQKMAIEIMSSIPELELTDEATPEARKMLADLFRAEGDLLSRAFPNRKLVFEIDKKTGKRVGSIWRLMTFGEKPEQGPRAEMKEDIPVKIHPIERKNLGIEDPLEVLNKFTDRLAQLRLIRLEAGALSVEDDKILENGMKLILRLEEMKDGRLFRRYPSEQELRSITDTLSGERKTIEEMMHEIEANYDAIRLLVRKRAESAEWQKDPILQKLATSVLEMGSFAGMENLLQMSSEWPLEKKGEISMDPRIDMEIGLKAIDRYIKAIQAEPRNEANYMALLNFLDKINFDDGEVMTEYKAQWLEIQQADEKEEIIEEAYKELAKTMADMVESKIRQKKMLMSPIGMEPEKKGKGYGFMGGVYEANDNPAHRGTRN